MKTDDHMMCIMEQFASEMKAFDLKADTRSFDGRYDKDGTFILELQTEPAPLKGNKDKVTFLRDLGYHVDVYAPRSPDRHRVFVARTYRRIAAPDTPR